MSILSVNDLCKNFGGLKANKDITFDVEENEILGLIGPNGAGKTTLFNCLTGFLKIDEGTVYFNQENIVGLPSYEIATRGIARTFQITKTFNKMTVLENVLVGAFLNNPQKERAMEVAERALEFCELGGKQDMYGSALNVPDRKRVELARALASQPTLLMLDEVAAGLNRTEVLDTVELIKRIRAQNITVIIVEHVMEVVLPLSDRVIVMDNGALIANGTPEEIVKNERVIKAYLGEEWDV